ncbi:MAG: TIGR00725 family protein [Caldiserica bacterium]|nr:MAG: TIGR00725 family protein [Caldisericota bacterium]
MEIKGIIGVIGGSSCNKRIWKIAYELGREIAKNGYALCCGGLGGVMEAASKGCYDEGGITIGILPGKSKEEANPYIKIPIVTAMSHARNAIITRTADILIAVDGKYGTLSEIALGFCVDKKIIGIEVKFDIPGIIKVKTPEEAIRVANKILRK